MSSSSSSSAEATAATAAAAAVAVAVAEAAAAAKAIAAATAAAAAAAATAAATAATTAKAKAAPADIAPSEASDRLTMSEMKKFFLFHENYKTQLADEKQKDRERNYSDRASERDLEYKELTDARAKKFRADKDELQQQLDLEALREKLLVKQNFYKFKQASNLNY